MKPKKKQALSLYKTAHEEVLRAGFANEITWQRQRAGYQFTERDLLRETAWVILCSGFRESSVRKAFDYISLCFCDWESSRAIADSAEVCVQTALARFNNRRKLQAIATAAQIIAQQGFEDLSAEIRADPIRTLQKFSFIGPITSQHLAKNLGFPTAKNDRHLARLANLVGFRDAHELCGAIASATSEAVSVVDIVLWRYAALQPRVLAA